MSADRDGLVLRLVGGPEGAADVAVREGDRRLTRRDLAGRTRRLAGVLRDEGVAPGEATAVMLPNSGAFAVAFLGAARRGAVLAPLSVRYREQELRYYLQETRAAALLVDPTLVPVAGPVVDALAEAPALVAVEADGEGRTVSRRRGDAGGVASDPAPLLHQYTSGSTGAPKRILRGADALALELAALAATWELGPADRFLGAAPFSHVNGLVRTLLACLYAGGTLHPLATFDRRRALRCVTEERLTHFGAVPYMFSILADTPVRGHVDLSSLRVAFSSSAPLLAEDNRRFAAKYGVFVRQLYGSTETGTISANVDPEPEAHPDAVGTPLRGVRLRVLSEDGEPLPAGREGEVEIASPWAIRAYDGNPEATARSFRDGAYLPGDLGVLDGEGRLTLTGRKQLLINRGGFKVNPLEVEKALVSHPKVREVVVYGAPARHGDDVVRAAVVVSEECSPEELVEHCRPRIADYKIPSRIEFRDALPKSAAGKVLRHRL